MNFREFASKVRAQAKDAASKIPTFDDMAANDEYIHSEEFNYRGKKPSPAQDNENASTGAGKSLDSVDNDEASSSSSWSLLDRRIASFPQELTPAPSPPREETRPMEGGRSAASESSDQNLVLVDQVAEPEPKSPKLKSSMPLLSVVANALEDSLAVDSKQGSALRGGSDHGLGMGENNMNLPVGLYGSDSEDDSLDEEDPILSMMRKDPSTNSYSEKNTMSQRSNKTDAETKKAKKSSRILDDLDQRLSSAEDQLAQQQATTSQQETIGNFPQNGSRFGNWARTVMTTQINRVLRRPEPTSIPLAASVTSRLPPLARTKPQNQNPTPDEEDFYVAKSSSVLGDDELAQLSKLKRHGIPARLVAVFQENRHFGFILFTLVLAVFSYFYSRRTLEDTVT